MTWNLIKFSAEEIIKLSIDIEKSGRTFYNTLAAKVTDTKSKEALQFLANEEDQHIKDFEALGAYLAKEFEANENYSGEYKDYLDSLIESHIFNQAEIEDKINKITDAKSALEMALRFEKDSIMIFQSFLNVVSGKAQEVIGKLINEEIGHIKKLSQLKKQL
jgi:rubrerythrin